MINGTGEGTKMRPDFGDNTNFDESVEAAWRALADQLATRLATLQRKEFVEVARTDMVGGYHLLLTFTLTGSGRFRCTVDGSAFTTYGVDGWISVQRTQRFALMGRGWRVLRNRTFIHEAGKRSIDSLVATAIQSLRQVWEFDDPSVLTVRDPFGPRSEEPDPPPFVLSFVPPVTGANSTPGAPAGVGIVPDDATHLLEMTRKILSARFGKRVAFDQKVIGFATDAALHTNILVSPQSLRLEFCTVLAHEIPDMDLLGAVVAEHSSRWPDVSIVVTKGHVFAVRAMEAAVFSHTNLLAALQAWQEFCGDGANDIIEQLQPGVIDTLDCTTDRVPDRLIDWVARFDQDPSAITPDTIVRSCRANTPMLRRYARIAADQIKQMNVIEQTWVAAGGSPEEIAAGVRQRQAIEQFMPVLNASISLAAELSVELERRRCG